MDDLEYLVKKFKCSRCKNELLGSLFDRNIVKGRSRPVSYFCKECRKKYDVKKEKKKCPECQYSLKLDINGLCIQCNKKLGVRQCRQCNKMQLLYVDFESISKKQFSTKCKDCTGYWDKRTKASLLKD